jgi:hypothetical protein
MRLLALPHWFNPLAWRTVRQFDECAEWACDEAARRSAPEHVPDYARALLQLVHRAQPVFFATRAARERGLSHRIRRLLTPATEKDAKMKKAMLATLVLGITLVSITRLRLRDNENPPPPRSETRTFFPASPAAVADRDVDDVAQTPHARRRAITVTAPRDRFDMPPIVDVVAPAAPAASLDAIGDPQGVVIPTKISARASGPTTPRADVLSDSAPTASPVLDSPAAPTAAIAPGLESHAVADASVAPRLAKIDPQYVLHGMQEYQRERARIATELENLKKSR